MTAWDIQIWHFDEEKPHFVNRGIWNQLTSTKIVRSASHSVYGNLDQCQPPSAMGQEALHKVILN